VIGEKYMTNDYKLMDYNQRNMYLNAIYDVIERGMAAKEVVCSITTGFRSIKSLRTKPGLNPYHASVADIGYGFDAVQGTINRIHNGEASSKAITMLVFELDTLKISEQQLSPNFELAVKNAPPEVQYLIVQSKNLNRQIAERIWEANSLGKTLIGPDWDIIRSRIANIQAVPRL
jgi:hypothetical protein